MQLKFKHTKYIGSRLEIQNTCRRIDVGSNAEEVVHSQKKVRVERRSSHQIHRKVETLRVFIERRQKWATQYVDGKVRTSEFSTVLENNHFVCLRSKDRTVIHRIHLQVHTIRSRQAILKQSFRSQIVGLTTSVLIILDGVQERIEPTN